MKHNGNPPAGVQPDLQLGAQIMLASAGQPPGDQNLTVGQADQLAEQAACALAYLFQLDRPPLVEPQFTAGDRRYLAGPLIVGDPAWGAATPAWLSEAVSIARLGLLLAGEHEQASEEEAVAYLLAASLAAPLHHDWAEIYFWLAARVLVRWGKVGQEQDFWQMIGEAVLRRNLRPDQEDDLCRLLRDIRRSVERHARTPHIIHTITHEGAHP
jgi:hypothetical protein